MTVLLGCSYVGEKLPLLFVGKSKKPRCFKNYDIKKFGIFYCANKAAWVNRSIFKMWINEINESMKHQQRKILMVLDNCTAHLISEPSNIKFLFLPPVTSSLIQPLDQGIIKCVKSQYRKQLFSFILEKFDVVQDPIKSIKIIDSIIYIKKIWDNLDKKIIINCWKHAELVHINDINEKGIKEDFLYDFSDSDEEFYVFNENNNKPQSENEKEADSVDEIEDILIKVKKEKEKKELLKKKEKIAEEKVMKIMQSIEIDSEFEKEGVVAFEKIKIMRDSIGVLANQMEFLDTGLYFKLKELEIDFLNKIKKAKTTDIRNHFL
jgi:hypothetical protein